MSRALLWLRSLTGQDIMSGSFSKTNKPNEFCSVEYWPGRWARGFGHCRKYCSLRWPSSGPCECCHLNSCEHKKGLTFKRNSQRYSSGKKTDRSLTIQCEREGLTCPSGLLGQGSGSCEMSLKSKDSWDLRAWCALLWRSRCMWRRTLHIRSHRTGEEASTNNGWKDALLVFW